MKISENVETWIIQGFENSRKNLESTMCRESTNHRESRGFKFRL